MRLNPLTQVYVSDTVWLVELIIGVSSLNPLNMSSRSCVEWKFIVLRCFHGAYRIRSVFQTSTANGLQRLSERRHNPFSQVFVSNALWTTSKRPASKCLNPFVQASARLWNGSSSYCVALTTRSTSGLCCKPKFSLTSTKLTRQS